MNITIEVNVEAKRLYTYLSKGKKQTVWCTIREFLELKRNYDDNGLTQVEEQVYQEIIKQL